MNCKKARPSILFSVRDSRKDDIDKIVPLEQGSLNIADQGLGRVLDVVGLGRHESNRKLAKSGAA